MERAVLKDFTFSDGTFIPRGTHGDVTALPVHMGEGIYEERSTFKRFQFVAEAREGADGEKDATKNQMVTTSRNTSSLVTACTHGESAIFEHSPLEVPFILPVLVDSSQSMRSSV